MSSSLCCLWARCLCALSTPWIGNRDLRRDRVEEKKGSSQALLRQFSGSSRAVLRQFSGSPRA
eukprot:9400713-Lingulodinium_polyedra.AAC.1